MKNILMPVALAGIIIPSIAAAQSAVGDNLGYDTAVATNPVGFAVLLVVGLVAVLFHS